MLFKNYQTVREYFIPAEKKSIINNELNLIIDFQIVTFFFALFYTSISYTIGYREGMELMALSAVLFFLGLFGVKKGYNAIYIKHFCLFTACFVSILGCSYFSGGLYSPVIPWFALLPILALLLFGTLKNTIIWLIIPILIAIGFLALSLMGFSCPITYLPEWRNIFYCTCLSGLTLVIFLVSYIFQSFINNNLIQLKAAQTQLIQSEKLASLGELTAGIAHEIQNPLNFVNNFSELSVDLVKDLKEEMERPDVDKEYIDELFGDLTANQEKINHHGKRASNIVKGMLEHSRVSTGVRELTDINALADEYLRLSYHGLRAKDKNFNADFSTDFETPLPKIAIVPQDIGRVLLNLINNAFYAVNEKNRQNTEGVLYKPNVTVSTQKIDNQIIIKVKDNGIGMPESVRAKVFQPFFTTKPTGQGTGLGLSLAYDIVTKGHGGTLEVESNVADPDNGGEGVGSEFIIRLPTTL